MAYIVEWLLTPPRCLRRWYVDDPHHLWGTMKEYSYSSLTSISATFKFSGLQKFQSELNYTYTISMGTGMVYNFLDWTLLHRKMKEDSIHTALIYLFRLDPPTTTWNWHKDINNGSIKCHCTDDVQFLDLRKFSLQPPPDVWHIYSISLRWYESLFKLNRFFETTVCFVLSHIVWLWPQPFPSTLSRHWTLLSPLIWIDMEDLLSHLSHHTVSA